MRLKYDLHLHTNCSDGNYSPEKVIDMAAQHGVDTIAITDHDTVAAHHEAVQNYATSAGVRLLAGVEISTVDEQSRRWHVLGLNIDPRNASLLEALQRYRNDRLDYALKVTEALQATGWIVNTEYQNGAEPVSKATIADSVLSAPKNQEKLKKVFGEIPQRGVFIEHFMNQGGEAYIPRVDAPTPLEALEIIKKSGGKALLAHPVAAIHEQAITLEAIEDFLIQTSGFDGIEAIYYYYAKSAGDQLVDRCTDFLNLAKKLGIIATAGSDFHGQSNIGNYIDIGMPNSRYSMSNEDLRELGIL